MPFRMLAFSRTMICVGKNLPEQPRVPKVEKCGEFVCLMAILTSNGFKTVIMMCFMLDLEMMG